MTTRVMFWIGALIVISGLLSYYSVERATIFEHAEQSKLQHENDQIISMQSFLDRQKDGRKLITLAKTINQDSPTLVKIVILRAYELEPNSRDIAILASAYDSTAKKRVKEIDPLYK